MSESAFEQTQQAKPAPGEKITVKCYRFLDGISGRYIFKTGVTAHFVNGIYRTNIPHQIAELDEMVELGRLGLATEIEEIYSGEDPLAALKAKIRAELEVERRAKPVTVLPDSEYDPGRLTPTSTRDLAGLSGMSTSVETSGIATAAPAAKTVVKVGSKHG